MAQLPYLTVGATPYIKRIVGNHAADQSGGHEIFTKKQVGFQMGLQAVLTCFSV